MNKALDEVRAGETRPCVLKRLSHEKIRLRDLLRYAAAGRTLR